MSRLVRTAALIALVTVFAAALGGWAGVQIGLHRAHARAGLDEIVHHSLNLSSGQERAIAAAESDYAAKRKALQAEMRAANGDLADALASEHAFGPRAQLAIARFHRAMASLQEETIRHVLAMRAVMTPDQAQRFDRLVSEALKPPAA